MSYPVTFTCPKDQAEFTANWSFGDPVTCPTCGTTYETDWETDTDDNVYGPWITQEVSK